MAFTYFWRDHHTLHSLLHMVKKRAPQSGAVRIWDAGCAMGQEPYTLMILLHELWPPELVERMELWATDYERRYEPIIRNAVYLNENLVRIPKELRQKHLEPIDERHSRVRGHITRHLRFQYHDLKTLHPIGKGFQAVVCKNVLLHFTPDDRVKILEMLHKSLAPGGLIATEQTQKMPVNVKPLFRQICTDSQLHEKI